MNLNDLVTCDFCGAQIVVTPSTSEIACRRCERQLHTSQFESSNLANSFESLHEQNEALLEEVSRLKKRNQIADLDREWDRKKETFFVSTKRGKRVPSRGRAIFGGIFGSAFSIAFASIGGASFPPLIGVGAVLLAISIFSMLYELGKADSLESAQTKYRNRRRRLRNER